MSSKATSERARWDSIGPPPVWLFAAEQARALGELAQLRARRELAKRMRPGDGHSVFVLPGFLAGDYSTLPLRRLLHQLHYDTHGWKEGVNLGPSDEVLERIGVRLIRIHERSGRKVSLVGWSLGGIYAREFARRNPERVRSVITMGTPFRDVTATHASRLIAVRSRPTPDRLEEIRRELSKPIPVPCTSIFSKTDGIVNWRSCLQDEGRECENIEVQSSHTGMGFHPEVLAIVANRLALAEGEWHPHARVQKKNAS